MEQSVMPPKQSTGALKAINIMLSIVIVLLVIVLLLLIFVFSPMTVSGDSMVSTFHDGDHVMMQKVGYDFNHGDIVIFERTGSTEKKIIKRVIGLPGDILRYDLDEKQWYRNDAALEESYVKVAYSDNYLNINNTNLTVYTALTSATGLTVNNNQLFVLGDNRNISYDSHIYGCISQDSIIGKYLFMY